MAKIIWSDDKITDTLNNCVMTWTDETDEIQHFVRQMRDDALAYIAESERQLAEAMTLLHSAAAFLRQDNRWTNLWNADGHSYTDRYAALVAEMKGGENHD